MLEFFANILVIVSEKEDRLLGFSYASFPVVCYFVCVQFMLSRSRHNCCHDSRKFSGQGNCGKFMSVLIYFISLSDCIPPILSRHFVFWNQQLS